MASKFMTPCMHLDATYIQIQRILPTPANEPKRHLKRERGDIYSKTIFAESFIEEIRKCIQWSVYITLFLVMKLSTHNNVHVMFGFSPTKL
jgi:hypothetical protein